MSLYWKRGIVKNTRAQNELLENNDSLLSGPAFLSPAFSVLVMMMMMMMMMIMAVISLVFCCRSFSFLVYT